MINPRPPIGDILSSVARRAGLPAEIVVRAGARGDRGASSAARHRGVFIAREAFGYSLGAIAQSVGYKSAGTVIHAITNVRVAIAAGDVVLDDLADVVREFDERSAVSFLGKIFNYETEDRASNEREHECSRTWYDRNNAKFVAAMIAAGYQPLYQPINKKQPKRA